MKTKVSLIVACLALVVSCSEILGAGSITFSFTGDIRFQQVGNVPGMAVGDQFFGSYTFDPLTVGQPFTPYDNTLDTEYWAITAWSVSIPSRNLSFSGSTGEIGVGNNGWILGDRYIVTMFPDTNSPISIEGHLFRFFQIDLFDPGSTVGADMLQNSALPLTPPDLNLVPDADQKGRFVFADASYQNRTFSLTLVPEPSLFALTLVGFVFLGRAASKRR